MDRKSKIIAALAIGALAILVGSGAARCSLSDAAKEAEPEPVACEQAAEDQDKEEPVEDSEERAAPSDGFESLAGSSWTMGGGGTTLSITPTNLVVSSPESSSVLYYSLEEESLLDEGLSATLMVSKAMNEAREPLVLLVESGPDGSQRIVCDKLGGAFTRYVADEVSITISNPDEGLFDAFGHSRDEFEAVLGEFAEGVSPHSTSATWDGEVWLDFNAGTKLTNFTLDGAAGSAVTVVDDGSGELTFR